MSVSPVSQISTILLLFCPTTSSDQGSPISYNYYHILQYLLEQTALLNCDVCVDMEIGDRDICDPETLCFQHTGIF